VAERVHVEPTREEMALRILCALVPSALGKPEDWARLADESVRLADALTMALDTIPRPQRQRPPMPPSEKAYLVGEGPPRPEPTAVPGPGKKRSSWWER